jgi:hypothetical protein
LDIWREEQKLILADGFMEDCIPSTPDIMSLRL